MKIPHDARCAHQTYSLKPDCCITRAVFDERARCAKVVEDFAKAYPLTVFPEPPESQHGKTIDSCHARALRDILPGVAAKIREED